MIMDSNTGGHGGYDGATSIKRKYRSLNMNSAPPYPSVDLGIAKMYYEIVMRGAGFRPTRLPFSDDGCDSRFTTVQPPRPTMMIRHISTSSTRVGKK